ncbi:MAG: hypothetical protein ACJ74U_07740 [Jatrophihabitantaceae bacterium]
MSAPGTPIMPELIDPASRGKPDARPSGCAAEAVTARGPVAVASAGLLARSTPTVGEVPVTGMVLSVEAALVTEVVPRAALPTRARAAERSGPAGCDRRITSGSALSGRPAAAVPRAAGDWLADRLGSAGRFHQPGRAAAEESTVREKLGGVGVVGVASALARPGRASVRLPP